MRLGLHSPCECRVSTELFSSRFRSSLASIPSPVYEVAGSPPPRRQIWRSTNPSSFETWKIGNMPSTSRLTWSSVPSSPTHICPFSSTRKCAKNTLTKSRQRVTFQGKIIFLKSHFLLLPFVLFLVFLLVDRRANDSWKYAKFIVRRNW